MIPRHEVPSRTAPPPPPPAYPAFPATSGGDRSAAEQEIKHAIDEYRRASGRMFPTWSEVLEVARGLGYEKRGEEGRLR